MRHFPWNELGYAFAFIAFFLVVYAVAYYCAVDRELVYSTPEFSVAPNYRFGREVFIPYHELDRILRPNYWSAEDLFICINR